MAYNICGGLNNSGGGDVSSGAVRFNVETDYLQYYDGTTWVNLMYISGNHIKTFIVFGSSLTASTGTFTVYFVDLHLDQSSQILYYNGSIDSLSFTLNTHTGYTFSTDISTKYGISKLQYNAQSTPYNTYVYASTTIMIKLVNVAAANNISDISSKSLPCFYTDLVQLASGNASVYSASSSVSNRVLQMGFIKFT